MAKLRILALSSAILIPLLAAQPATALAQGSDPMAAQDETPKEPKRTRVGLGAQLVPSFPGSDDFSVRPLFDLSRARGSDPFPFEAADESFGFPLIRSGGFQAGPALGFEGSRKAKDIGVDLDKVGVTVEAGGFAQYAFGPNFRIRGELRQGIGGHDGLVGNVGGDVVMRDGDRYLFSIGPRISYGDGDFHRAFFGVTPAESVRTGLATFAPDGGLYAVGATAGLLFQLSPRWGVYSYAKYDRLIEDAARSPVVRGFGTRNQLSGGLALTYTFGG